MFHEIRRVSPLPNLRLQVQFVEGKTKVYDVSQLYSRWPALLALRDIPGLFSSVRVDTGGYGISWNDELDLSCDELWNHGWEVFPPLTNY